ncbi:ricin-type beta-trefoil lectin domain protein [Kitasatospora sp. LaBMicrA B282]|uniref:ricin-type beta-trefoil lectin domain protein n=1 Tax=Kitasatospora sp. LaBMicrA B282 TaxID=3420949 RepID=UPI003D0EBB8D
MRRTAAVLTTTLLAAAAALTVPAAAQAAPTSTKAAQAGGCIAWTAGPSIFGTCSGISPYQIWYVTATCDSMLNGVPFSRPAFGPEAVGNGSTSAGCNFGDTIVFPHIVFAGTVPPPVAGPQGQITGYVGKCVDDAGASTNNGTHIQIYDCNGTNAQHWTVGVDGTLRVLGKCMDVQGGGTANHTMVQLYDCNGTGAQQWKPQPNGSLLNPQSGRCLDDLGFGTNNGNQLGIWDCNGAANQKWVLPH